MDRLLGAPAEQGPLQLLDQRSQMLALAGEPGGRGPLGEEQRLQRRDIVGQRLGSGGV
jgi:hypothetical protein